MFILEAATFHLQSANIGENTEFLPALHKALWTSLEARLGFTQGSIAAAPPCVKYLKSLLIKTHFITIIVSTARGVFDFVLFPWECVAH